ncbi:YciI family protein [Ornithinimicrobium cryptoxanthini]|uniref:YciI family protein n=1 Tax=Ornithinimicrobium cryptoxanthini TaxID=2934161 RepID=A0ABY4YL98_9MICO|nr:YciI family protein [Ornithinimicrobium cryptoxanthini]USQ76917.1 YciI family protein [Ornithinimicrobium cryptoxanthini]
MKRYLILIAYEPGGWDRASEEARATFFEQHAAFSAFVAEHGRESASAALDDTDTATTVRHVDGKVVVTDGPFAETAEMIGGYYEVELPDLDSAIAAAALLPPSYTLEIRPVIDVT